MSRRKEFKKNNKRLRGVTNKTLNELKTFGFYLYHDAVTSSSFYLKNIDNSMGSIRISDHSGIKRYRYRWNITLYGKTRIEVDCGVTRYYFNVRELDYAILFIRQRKTILDNVRRFSEIKSLPTKSDRQYLPILPEQQRQPHSCHAYWNG